MKAIICGSKGYLGQGFAKLYPTALQPHGDIVDQDNVEGMLEVLRPDIVINCAGKTGRPNIDWCEDHKLETLAANVRGPLLLMEECLKRNIYFVQIGSGCIYSGNYFYPEEAEPNFEGSYYSKTKILVEKAMSDFPVLILRLRMPFDGTDHPRNLINKLKGYQEVLNVQNSMTYMPDFYKAAATLIEKRETGIFNIVNDGIISPYDIMEWYAWIIDPNYKFKEILEEDLYKLTKAPRSNCSLSNLKMKKLGIKMMPVQEAIKQALFEMKDRALALENTLK